MNDVTSSSSANKYRVGLFVLMVAVGAVSGYVAYRNRGVDQPGATDGRAGTPVTTTSPLSVDEVRQLVELKDVSIGYLENGPAKVQVSGQSVSGLDMAVDGFATLAQKLPQERLPLQDLAITQLLLLQNAQSDLPARREEARSAAQRLLDFDPRSGCRALDRGHDGNAPRRGESGGCK